MNSERRTKRGLFIVVFARPEEKREQKAARFFIKLQSVSTLAIRG